MRYCRLVLRWSSWALAALLPTLGSLFLLLAYQGSKGIGPAVEVSAGGWYALVVSLESKDLVRVVRGWPGTAEVRVRLFSRGSTDYAFMRDGLTRQDVLGSPGVVGRTTTIVDDAGRPRRLSLDQPIPLGLPESDTMGYREAQVSLFDWGVIMAGTGALLIIVPVYLRLRRKATP